MEDWTIMSIDLSQLISDAGSGDLDAQLQLADLYESGFGVSVDLAQAAYWYRKAAEAGSAKAQNLLGQFFINGKGIARIIRRHFTGSLYLQIKIMTVLRLILPGVINVALAQKKTYQVLLSGI